MRNYLAVLIMLFSLDSKGQVIKVEDDKQAYYVDHTELMVNFPGGDSAYKKYIVENLKYPDSLKIHNIQGNVYVQYAIDSTGKIMDIKIIKGLDPELDNKIIQVFTNMPLWEWDKILKKIPAKTTKMASIKFEIDK